MGDWHTLMAPSREMSENFPSRAISGSLEEGFRRRSPVPGPIGERESSNYSPPKYHENNNEAKSTNQMNVVGSVSQETKVAPSWSIYNQVPQSNNTDVFSNVQARKTTDHQLATMTSNNPDDEHRKRLENLRLNAQEQFGDWLSSPRQGQSGQPIPKDVLASGNVISSPSPPTPLPQSSLFAPSHQGRFVLSPSPSFGQGMQSSSQQIQQIEKQQQDQREPVSTHSAMEFLNQQAVYDYQDGPNPEYDLHLKDYNHRISTFTNPLPSSSALVEPEYSVFVGDLCPDLREEDLVSQFTNPPVWPSSHPFAIAHAHAQQAQGKYGTPPKIGPAPFLSTKSAAIMTDPLTGISRGFGFVRFTSEIDCARALVEMQGVTIHPASGQGGRPLRVCPATPKNRSSSNPTQSSLSSAPVVQEKLMNAIRVQPEITSPLERASQQDLMGKTSAISPTPSSLHHSLSLGTLNTLARQSQFSVPIIQPSTPSTSKYEALVSPSLLMTNSGVISGNSDANNTTVFVGGLSSLISEETLKTFFVPFGEIKYVKIPPGKGCGFVQFVNKAEAERAIDRMQGFPIGGGRIRLSWGRSQSDKAAAAAAQAAAQAAQIGHLAGLAGLSSDTTSQLTAAHLAAGTGTNNTTTDAHAQLIKQLTAAAMSGSKMSQRNNLTGNQQSGYFGNDHHSTIATNSTISPLQSFSAGVAPSTTFDPFADDQQNSPWSDKSNRTSFPTAKRSSSSSQDLTSTFTSLQLDNSPVTRGADHDIWSSQGGIGYGSAGGGGGGNGEMVGDLSIGSNVDPLSLINSNRQRGHTIPFSSGPWNSSFTQQSSLQASAKPFVISTTGRESFGSINQQQIESSTIGNLQSSNNLNVNTSFKRPSHQSFLDPLDSRFNPFASSDELSPSPSTFDNKEVIHSSSAAASNKSKRSNDEELYPTSSRQSSSESLKEEK